MFYILTQIHPQFFLLDLYPDPAIPYTPSSFPENKDIHRMTLSIDHINIVVSDLNRSISFYTALLGFRETRRACLEGEWIDRVTGLKGVRALVAYIQPHGQGPRIELIQYITPQGETIPATTSPNTIGLRHIAFRVDSMHAYCQRLSGASIRFISDPNRVPNEVVQHDAGNKQLCYFLDPDGVLLELAEYT